MRCNGTLNMVDASVLVPGGLRGLHGTQWYREMVNVLSSMCTRMDVLSSMLLVHRV